MKLPKYKPRINYKVDITIEDLNIVNYTEMGYAAEVVLNGDDRIKEQIHIVLCFYLVFLPLMSPMLPVSLNCQF